ncbi:hypothetical protein ACI48D_04980 [Massilia sp. LXY-6]|uniref:hypothetical protein n=1 Tax=Massilia sp. LXY-6 TaxID=3379823 RepID=UPI003EE18C4B
MGSMKHFLLVSALMVGCMPQAKALRPFDGTDAAVTDKGKLEFELGYLGLLRDGETKYLSVPALVMNAGLSSGSELVLEGRLRTRVGGISGASGSALEDAAISLKHVYREGILQGEKGLSIASECGLLVPTQAGERAGMVCAGIVSQRLSKATIHVNATLARSRERQWERLFGLIVEGPRYGRLEPVFEGLVGATSGGVRMHSLLVGVITSMADNLTFDVGLRTGRDGVARVAELRAGLTWSPP